MTFNREFFERNREFGKGENNPMYGLKGELHPRYGKKHSEETKKKISEMCRGKCKTYDKNKNQTRRS